jgi:hypothetical protein
MLEVALERPGRHGNEFPKIGERPTGFKMVTNQNLG